MKRKHSLTYKPYTTYFITTTITEFTRVFIHEETAQIFIDKLKYYLDEFSVKLHGFVIMQDHVHLLITTGETGNVSQFVGRLKERIAKHILKWCVENKYNRWVNTFESSAGKYKTGSRYQIWQERFDALEIISRETFDIKLNYIHNNPLQRKWGLCDKPEDFRLSSARYYMLGEDVGVPITIME
jgi:putative transposase